MKFCIGLDYNKL